MDYAALVLFFILVAVIDVLLAVLSLLHRNKPGHLLGASCLGAAVVTSSYLASVFVEDYFLYSVLSSIYFCGIDVALYALLLFVRDLTQIEGRFTRNVVRVVITGYTVFDIAVLLLNPFREIAIRYVYERPLPPHYGYEMMPLYQMHLILAYIYVILILSYLIRKIRQVPSVYRRQYTNCVWILVAVVLINVVYLYYQTYGNTAIDYSLLGYSLAAFLFYWNAFVYSNEDMLNQLKRQIFQNLDEGIVLFDYHDQLILENEKAGEMFAGTVWEQENTLDSLLTMLERKPEDDSASEFFSRKYSFQCYPAIGDRICPMLCEYSPLMSGRNEMLGKLFVFSSLSQEFDTLTGFRSWESYKRMEENNRTEDHPVNELAVACDINGLMDINRTMGHSGGDRAILTLAQHMRQLFPAGTNFVRGREAILVAVCNGIGVQEVDQILAAVEASMAGEDFGSKPLDFQSAIQLRKPTETRTETVRGSMNMLSTRKLLNQNSRHSAVLYSLIQTLKECDKDTEAHVRRTQKMCEQLSRRIGLSEEDQSKLSLLSILHDIGKVGIPLDILNKPGKLTDAEWAVIRSHVEKGYQITHNTEELSDIAEMVLYHHERWDGKGYPDGLSKEAIPLLSRIIAVVDAYDAMVNDRSYRRAMPTEQAVQELRRCAGTQFDPTIVSEFLAMLEAEGYITPEEAAGTAGGTGGQSPYNGVKDNAPLSVEMPEPADQKSAVLHKLRYAKYILDTGSYRILEADAEFERLTGYSRDDIETLRLTQLDLICEEDRKAYRSFVSKSAKSNESIWLEHRIRCKDGHAIFVSCYGRLYYDSAHRQNRAEIIISDISESYSAQAAVNTEH